MVAAALLITALPGSVLALGQPDDQPVERLADRELAGEAGIGLGERGKAQHAGFLRARYRAADDPEPRFLNIDMAGGAGAFAAAIGVNPRDVVLDRAAHDRTPE